MNQRELCAIAANRLLRTICALQQARVPLERVRLAVSRKEADSLEWYFVRQLETGMKPDSPPLSTFAGVTLVIDDSVDEESRLNRLKWGAGRL